MNNLLAAANEFIRLAEFKKSELALEVQHLMSSPEENESEIDTIEEFRSDIEIAISRVEDVVSQLNK